MVRSPPAPGAIPQGPNDSWEGPRLALLARGTVPRLRAGEHVAERLQRLVDSVTEPHQGCVQRLAIVPLGIEGGLALHDEPIGIVRVRRDHGLLHGEAGTGYNPELDRTPVFVEVDEHREFGGPPTAREGLQPAGRCAIAPTPQGVRRSRVESLVAASMWLRQVGVNDPEGHGFQDRLERTSGLQHQGQARAGWAPPVGPGQDQDDSAVG